MGAHDPTVGAELTSFESFNVDRELTLEEAMTIGVPDAAEASVMNDLTPAEPTAATPILPPTPPFSPFPLPRRAVSGRYRSGTIPFELELRVDVDRVRPMKRVSGDVFQQVGATKKYFGSFVVDAITMTVTTTMVTLTGLGRFSWNAGAPRVRVTIPRVNTFQPQAPATVQFFTIANAPGATLLCRFESPYFRTVTLETDRVSDVTTPVFAAYDTGSLPSGGPARNLTVPGAYAEAGVEVLVNAGSVVPIGNAGAGASWSDAELHASMLVHFSLWREEPQWRVWELVAQAHDLGPGLLGIMFDQQGRQRQGCAVFHAGLGGTTLEQKRLQLYTYVHELGHCFNLLHSWQKSLATPPGTDRPAARSWMNYPWRFAGGPAAFWSVFPFIFDDGELVHLRHGFLNNEIMGGANYAVGSSASRIEKFELPVEDHSGLRFELSAPNTNRFMLGEPVTVTLKLTATDPRIETVHPYLNPEAGLVHIAIKKPGGEIVPYEPLIDHCVAGERMSLSHDATSIQETVYIGYGRDGLNFDQSGTYEIRAVYDAIDGSQIVSNILRLRVKPPVSAEDEHIADLLLGDDQGALFYLRGSDSEALNSGKRALDTLVDQYGKHPLAEYARFVKAVNLSRDFKTITADQEPTIQLRSANQNESATLLSGIVASGRQQTRLDPASLEVATARLAHVQRRQGDEKGASATEEKLKRSRRRTVRV
jgi:hypothetical protein